MIPQLGRLFELLWRGRSGRVIESGLKRTVRSIAVAGHRGRMAPPGSALLFLLLARREGSRARDIEVGLPDLLHFLVGILARLLAFVLPGSWSAGTGGLAIERIRFLVLVRRTLGLVEPNLPLFISHRIPRVAHHLAENVLPLLDVLRDTAILQELGAKFKEPVGWASRGLARGRAGRTFLFFGENKHVAL